MQAAEDGIIHIMQEKIAPAADPYSKAAARAVRLRRNHFNPVLRMDDLKIDVLVGHFLTIVASLP